MNAVQSLFPINSEPDDLEQELARKHFRMLTRLARQEGVDVPQKAALSGNDDGTLDVNVVLPGRGLLLQWGVDYWDTDHRPDRKGVIVGVSLHFGGESIQVIWTAVDGWEAIIDTTGETTSAAEAIDIAFSFGIRARPESFQPLMRQEAEVFAERMFRHYLANRAA